MKTFLTLGVAVVLAYLLWINRPVPTDWKALSEAQWRQRLTPQQYEVLRESATEDAFSGPLNREKREGHYRCAGCRSLLFRSQAKFDSGTGWPSFDAPEVEEAVSHHRHNTHLGVAVEVRCTTCGGHLGHLFPDGPTPTGNRYCINSAALQFEPKE